MKTKHIFLPLIALALYISACQKDFNVDNVTVARVDSIPPVSVITDSNYLSKVIYLSSTNNGLSFDTFMIDTFAYDNLKRVSSFYTYPINNTTHPHYTKNAYFYQGNDTIPYKYSIIDSSDGVGFFLRDTTFSYCFYDSFKRKIKDSIIENYLDQGGIGSGLEIVYYTYVGNSIYGLTSIVSNHTNSNTYFVNFKDTCSVDANGNILSDKKYRMNGGNYVLDAVSNFTYDNFKNPLAKLSIFKA